MAARRLGQLDHEILRLRGPKRTVSPDHAYAAIVEEECTAERKVESVATVFLTNRECPFRCLMCDLWKNTLDRRIAAGLIPRQIETALNELPSARHLKLYNSGNFFDRQAIPPEDIESIVKRVQDFETVIIENHPKLVGPACLRLQDQLKGRLEVAMGLETIHPHVLPKLNKQMTVDDFARAAEFLVEGEIRVRAFILLRPPYLSESEGIDWACRSVRFARDCGVEVCSVIPTRSGNGMLDELARRGEFAPPVLRSLEAVLDAEMDFARGRLFADLWDAAQFAECSSCAEARLERLQRMNLMQVVLPPVECACEVPA